MRVKKLKRKVTMDPYDSIYTRFKFVSKRDISPLCTKRGTRLHLPLVFNDLGFKRGAEIGVRAAAYSKVICDLVPGVELFCIDPWMKHNSISQERQEEYIILAKETLKPYNAKFIRKYSMDALTDFENRSLDFVFIDGDHLFDFVAPDIIFWAQKVKRYGIIAVHDYCNCYMGGVIKAVDAYTYCHRIEPWFVTGEPQPTAFWVNP